MKVLIDHPWPFALAHGGLQIQIEQTKAALERRGAQVEYVRWWDEQQKGDLIHYFGRPDGAYIDAAHAKGMKVIVAELLTGLGSRSDMERFVQKTLMRLAKSFLPGSFLSRMGWDAYQKADGFVAAPWDAELMRTIFDADPNKIRVIGNGVEDIFFQKEKTKSTSDHLLCTGTIHPRKRVLELAEAAAQAQISLRIIGKPYSESDSYYQRFLEFQKHHADLIRYDGPIDDRSKLANAYQEARGFVLLSTQESLSLSAGEAAAAGCPLLLSDLPWARKAFGSHATYIPVSAEGETLAPLLRVFFDRAPFLPPGPQPLTWDEIADQLLVFYRECLKRKAS